MCPDYFYYEMTLSKIQRFDNLINNFFMGMNPDKNENNIPYKNATMYSTAPDKQRAKIINQWYLIMEEHYAVMRSAEFLTQLSSDVLNENNSIYQSAKSIQFSLFRYLYCKFILAKDLNTFHLGSFFMYQFLVDNIKSINYWLNNDKYIDKPLDPNPENTLSRVTSKINEMEKGESDK